MSLIARRGLILFLVAFSGVALLSVALGYRPDVAGGATVSGDEFCGAEAEACMELAVLDPPDGACADGKCDIVAGAKFTLAVDIVKKPAEGYILAQSTVAVGEWLEYNPSVDLTAEFVWPDCAISLRGSDTATFAIHGCLTGLTQPQPKSHYVGTFVLLSVTCSLESSNTLVELIPATQPLASVGALMKKPDFTSVIPDVADLTVNCVGPDTPTPGGPDTATPTPSDTPEPSPTPGGPDTATPTPSDTAEPSPTQGGPDTPTPSATPTGTLTPATATPAVTPLLTSTPANAPTSTPRPTHTPTRRPSLLGDVTCDGTVNPVDAVFLLQLAAALIDELPCPDAGDADGDGETTVIDATVILQFSAGLVSSLPP